MASRLHKVIGYGLVDLAVEKNQYGSETVIDPRLNLDSPLLYWDRFEEEDEEFEIPSVEDYAAWLKQRGDRDDRAEIALLRAHADGDMIDCVVSEKEGGLGRVLVLTAPAWVHRWKRCDDSIDWAEMTLHPEGAESVPAVTLLKHAPSPFQDRLMDSADGTELDSNAGRFLHLAEAGLPNSDLDELVSTIRPLRPNDDRPVFYSAAEARGRIVPAVPSDIRNLIEFGAIFTDPETWLQLRPILYTYWG